MRQKFLRGHRVHIEKITKPWKKHFPCDVDAIVNGTYATLHGYHNDRAFDDYQLVLLDDSGKPFNQVSWYEVEDLTLVSEDRIAGEELIEKYLVDLRSEEILSE